MKTIGLAHALPLLAVLAAPAPGASPDTPPSADAVPPPAAAFARFATLSGTWKGQSTKGWTDEVATKLIAGGSAVMMTSFDAHPGETMATLVHMDGERLLLTHYCVAKNQPRLLATAFDDGGATVTFTFLDATNLPSRDKGHMDKAVFHFVDRDHYTTRWTWYQGGAEKWMEEIRMERIR